MNIIRLFPEPPEDPDEADRKRSETELAKSMSRYGALLGNRRVALNRGISDCLRDLGYRNALACRQSAPRSTS